MKVPVKPGARGWLLVAWVVITCDLLEQPTLSEAFRDFSRTPAGRPVSIAGWALLTAHLFGLIPRRYDPVHLAFTYAVSRTALLIRKHDDR